MSGKDLLEGMSYVDERFVDEAEHQTIAKSSVTPWMKWTSLAACICLILFSTFYIYHHMGQETGEEITSGNVPAGPPPAGPPIVGNGQYGAVGLPSAQPPVGEVPSVILRVDSITKNGFIGTVAQLVDTDIFELHMELNVVVAERTENKEYLKTGSYVMVQFIEYNRENKTIVINVIDAVEPPK